MLTIGQRVVRVRRSRKETQGQFAKHFGVDQSTISKWENGRQVPESAHMDILAGLDPEGTTDATTPAGSNSLFTMVPLVGYVGAGAVVHLVAGGAGSSEIEYIKAPRGFGAVEALGVRGDSMYPVYRNGDTVFFDGREAELPILVQDEYVVELSDGRMLLKLVQPSNNGTYTLIAYNASPIQGAEIVRAFKVRYIRRG